MEEYQALLLTSCFRNYLDNFHHSDLSWRLESSRSNIEQKVSGPAEARGGHWDYSPWQLERLIHRLLPTGQEQYFIENITQQAWWRKKMKIKPSREQRVIKHKKYKLVLLAEKTVHWVMDCFVLRWSLFYTQTAVEINFHPSCSCGWLW